MESLHPPEHVADLYRLSDPGLSDLGLEALLDELLVRIREILDVDTAAILLLDEDLAALVPRAADGLEGEVGSGLQIPIGKGFAGRVAAERAPVAISNLEEAEIVNPILRERGVQSLLGVPLVVEGALIGGAPVGAPASASVRERGRDRAGARRRPGSALDRAGPALRRPGRRAPGRGRPTAQPVARAPAAMLAEAMAGGPLPAGRHRRRRSAATGTTSSRCRGGRVGLVIGDVAGHGVLARPRLMGQRAQRRCAPTRSRATRPAVALGLLDRMLRVTRERAMATVIYAIIDPETGRIRYASAGHPHPSWSTRRGPA